MNDGTRSRNEQASPVDSTPHFRAMAQRIVDRFYREYPDGTEPSEQTCIAMEYLKLSALSESEPTELQVQAGAVILATTPLIDAPKLDHMAWMGLSRAILEAANAARR